MAVSTTKENIFTKFGAFISKIWHSISNFFKPDNIEEVPVSSLSTYLRTHLKFIENIISHYKPGQKGGISFDALIMKDETVENTIEEKSKSKAKTQESKKAKTSKIQSSKVLDSKKQSSRVQNSEKQVSKVEPAKVQNSEEQDLDSFSKASSKKPASTKNTVEKQTVNPYGDLDKFTNILKGKDIDSPER